MMISPVSPLMPSLCRARSAMIVAMSMVEGPSLAQGLIKQSMKHGLAGTLDQGLAQERANQSQLFLSADAQEGVKAFLEKRKPQFQGR